MVSTMSTSHASKFVDFKAEIRLDLCDHIFPGKIRDGVLVIELFHIIIH